MVICVNLAIVHIKVGDPMKTCYYCGDIVSFKGHGDMVCDNCVDELKKRRT